LTGRGGSECIFSFDSDSNCHQWYLIPLVSYFLFAEVIECVPDTISIDSLKRNDPEFTNLKTFFAQHFGSQGSNELCNAKANFVESLAVSYDSST
jgi:hypothetical protein